VIYISFNLVIQCGISSNCFLLCFIIRLYVEFCTHIVYRIITIPLIAIIVHKFFIDKSVLKYALL